jgi:hypothetical protein
MKKIKQRKGLVALMALGALFLYLGGHLMWEGITHVGAGAWKYGGDEGWRGSGTEEYWAVIPEHQYKRECYAAAGGLFLFGGVILWGIIAKWKERNELEKSWEQSVSNPVNGQEILRHPEYWPEDFRQWIKENHPNLLV